MRALPAALCAALLVGAAPAAAHPLAPALLEIEERGEGLADVTWKQPLQRVRGGALRPLLPDGCAATSAPVSEIGPGSLIQRWSIRCESRSLSGGRVGVEGLDRSGTNALVRVALRDGRRVLRVVRGGAPFFVVPDEVHALDAARSHLALGFAHLLGGPDHLLFVFGLLLLVAGWRPLVATVTAFTLGHSVTLSLATFGVVALPARAIELGIALSVFALAVELARDDPERPGLLRRWPAALAFSFGLLHGLGFAAALSETGLPPREIPLALLAFNVGIELGQLLFIGAVLVVRRILRAPLARLPRWAENAPVYALGSLAAFWCLQRAAALLP